MVGPVTRMTQVAETVSSNLGGAEVIGMIFKDITRHGNYWERSYEVAWKRSDMSGTHRVHIDSNGMGACFVGHYDMDAETALEDMLVRAGISPASSLPKRKRSGRARL